MELFWKSAACALLAVVLGIALDRQERTMQLLLTLFVCCLIAAAAFSYLEPVLDFFRLLEDMISTNGSLIPILLKSVGISIVTETVCLLCHDAGNTSLGKHLQLLGSAVILWLNIPVFQTLITLVQEILNGI